MRAYWPPIAVQLLTGQYSLLRRLAASCIVWDKAEPAIRTILHYGVELVPVFVTGDSGTFAGETEFAAAIAAAKKHPRHLLRQQQVNKEK